MFTEPHSTKPIEDGVGWGLETTPETLIATVIDGLDEEDRARTGRSGALPGAGHPGDRDRDHRQAGERAGGGDRRRFVLLEGRGHCHKRATRLR